MRSIEVQVPDDLAAWLEAEAQAIRERGYTEITIGGIMSALTRREMEARAWNSRWRDLDIRALSGD